MFNSLILSLVLFVYPVLGQEPVHPYVCLLDEENQADCVGICSESFVFTSASFQIVEEILFVADAAFTTRDYFEYIVSTF